MEKKKEPPLKDTAASFPFLPHALAQLEEVAARRGRVVDQQVDDQVAAGRLEEDGHDGGACV